MGPARQLADAGAAFHASIVEMGLGSQVTTFTASFPNIGNFAVQDLGFMA